LGVGGDVTGYIVFSRMAALGFTVAPVASARLRRGFGEVSP
jgi:hypothetical protein